MYNDIIYNEFHIMNEHFTVEDYAEHGKALFHEGMFVSEIKDINDAYAAAVSYLSACRY